MKITLDLSKLVEDGKLTPAEAERLKGFAAKDTGELGSNVLFALGAAAVATGVGVLVPTLETAVALGAVLFVAGFWLRVMGVTRWAVFAQIVMVIGARFQHIEQRVRAVPSQEEFRNGWRNRNRSFLP